MNEFLGKLGKVPTKEEFDGLSQWAHSQQSRIDYVNKSQVEAQIQNSADHAAVVQLMKLSNLVVQTVSGHAATIKDLIQQLRDVHIDGSNLLDAIEEAAGTTVNQLITAESVKQINSTLHQINVEKTEIVAASQALTKRINRFERVLIITAAVLGVVSFTPWVWGKLVVVGIGLIGGVLYEKN